MYILNVIKNIFAILDKSAKSQYIFLQIFFLVAAIFQVIGIASIAPFIAILSNPEIIHTNAALALAYEIGGFSTDLGFIMAAAVGSLAMILVSNFVATLTVWYTYKFSVTLGSKLQRSVYKSFLRRSYLYHKTKNYNYMISIVSQQVPRFVYMVFQPFLLLTSQLFVAAIILVGLVFLDPLLAVVAGTLIGGSYLATYIYLRKSLAVHGETITQRNRIIQGILSESFIGIKDIKLGSMEDKYLTNFNSVNSRGLKSQAFIALAGQIPKFVIESLSFGALLILALVLLTSRSEISSVVPILSIYALAGYKMLPTMQQVYKSISSLSGHGSVARVIREELLSKEDEHPEADGMSSMALQKIVLENVSFSYPESENPAVRNVSLTLEKGNIYSLAGHSGSGKSTLADLLLGLLELDEGSIIVNGDKLTNEKLGSFRNSLSYVAQSIFILDDSVTKNVAFGVPEDKIDRERVALAVELANATEFVKDLPQGFETNLGQDGKLLSGGQRQRIGIARALYRKSELLVLDEPTSALDLESEYKLLQTLNEIKENLIIMIISHRPASIKMSDKIVIMNDGSVRSIGTYRELMKSDNQFREMLEKSMID